MADTTDDGAANTDAPEDEPTTDVAPESTEPVPDEAPSTRSPTAPEAVPTADTNAKGKRLSRGEIIANRSADIHTKKAAGNRHVKVFVLPPGPKPTEENGYDHSANKAATIQYAISQGMRPTEKGVDAVELDSIEPHANGISWVLTYSVEVVVAEAITEASGPEVVTEGENVSTNTDGNGHSGDTRRKAARR